MSFRTARARTEASTESGDAPQESFMVKMFVLQGVHDSGKTSTLRILDELLRKKYPDMSGEPKYSTRGKNKDFQVIYTLKVNGNKRLIGIKTDGDNGEAVYKDVGWLVDNQCNIIFCSCRSYGSTVESVKRLSEEADVRFVKKTLEADEAKRRKANVADAQKLLTLAGL